MAYKQKGFPMHSTKSALKAHPSKELDRLKADVKTFQSQYNEDPNERTKKDLDWAKQALEEYMSGAHGDSPLDQEKGGTKTLKEAELKEKPTSGEITQVQNLLYKMEMNPGNYPIPPETQKILDKYPGFSWGEGEKDDSPLESVDDTEGTTWYNMLKKMAEKGVPHEKKKTTEERLAEIEQMQEWWDKKDERKKKTEERDRVNEEIERIEKEHDKRWKNMGFPY